MSTIPTEPSAPYKAVTVYETRDRKHHSEERFAAEWAQWLDDLDAANAMLDAGSSLADALDRAEQTVYPYRVGETRADRETLALITRDTKLRISHWQCHDRPCYSIGHIDNQGRVHAGGVGGWSGYYGNPVPVDDLVRYAKDTFRRHPEVLQQGTTHEHDTE